MNDGVMGAVNGAMPSPGLQQSSPVSRWVRDPHFTPGATAARQPATGIRDQETTPRAKPTQFS